MDINTGIVIGCVVFGSVIIIANIIRLNMSQSDKEHDQ